MPQIPYFSEAEVAILREVVADKLNSRQNPPVRFGTENSWDEGEDHQAPETYIALAPEAGIPPLSPPSGTGSASFGSGDVPGSALCDIYQLARGVLLPIDYQQRVYNLSASTIEHGWILVTREKFGHWLAIVGGGGGGTCANRNEVWQIWIIGDPSGGAFDMTFAINSVTETVAIDYDASASEVATALATHSELTSGDVSVSGGSFPGRNVNVEFIGSQAAKSIRPPTIDLIGLFSTPGTGTVGDIEGVGVVVTRYQPGYPN